MSETQDASVPLGVGNLVKQTITTIFANLGVFIPLALIGFVPVILLVMIGFWVLASSGDTTMLIVFGVLVFLLMMVATMLVNAFIAEATFRVRTNSRRSMGEYVASVMPRIVPIMLTALLVILIFIGGTLLLVVPGIIAMIVYYVTIPACVVEHLGPRDALRRSSALTKGYRWPLFGFFVILTIINGVIVAVFQFGFGFLEQAAGMDLLATIGMGLGDILGNFLSVILGGVATALTYARLREIKDGLGQQELASVFD